MSAAISMGASLTPDCGERLLIGQLLSVVQRYPPLVDGAFIIIAWVGIKLLIEYLHQMHYIAFEVPKWLSLGLIVVIFTASYAYARRVGAVEVADDEPPDAAEALFTDAAEPEDAVPVPADADGEPGAGGRPASPAVQQP